MDAIKEMNQQLMLNYKNQQENFHLTQKDSINKKYISSFLINFFDKNASKKTQTELKATLASLLDFDENDKKRIGVN